METLLITKLTIKSDLQYISLTNKQLFSQSTIYNSFRLKKRNLISIFIVVIFFGLTYYIYYYMRNFCNLIGLQ